MNYYSILGLNGDCSEPDIRKAYRKLAKQYHPDVNKSRNAHDKFIEISEAYEFLIRHHKKYKEQYSTTKSPEYYYTNDYRKSEEYEQFRQEVREKAHQQAKMRYEEFRKKHEAFQQSGMNDIAFLFTLIARIGAVFIFFLLLLLPVHVALQDEWKMIFLFVITWPFAGIIAWYVYENRKQYFIPGKMYYTPGRIIQLFRERIPTGQRCFYCPSEWADSKPYKLDLLKLKGIKAESSGFRQHNVNYINDYSAILIPRSRKAFIIHSLCTFIKIISVIAGLIFITISSFFWRFILGMLVGGVITVFILWITRTKSNVSYLLSLGSIIRAAVWMFLIILVTKFSSDPFNIIISDTIYFVFFSILLFDAFLMQFLNFVFGKYSSMPVFRQFPEVQLRFDAGYKVYNDIPVISFVYPLIKWIFG